jgi:hypothetical protein
MATTERSLPNLVKDITFFYIKHHYQKYLTEKNVEIVEESLLRDLIDKLYNEKQQELRDYIRNNLKVNLKEKYSTIATESIITEMFFDPRIAKERVIIEILRFQENKIKQN